MLKKIFFLLLVVSFSFSNVIEIYHTASKRIEFEGLQRVLVIEGAENIEVLPSTKSFQINTIKPGEGKILVITDTKKYILKVKVLPRIIHTKTKSNIDYSGKKFSGNLSIGHGNGYSRSVYPQHEWDYGYMYYKFSTRGETNLGLLKFLIDVKNGGTGQGVNRFTTSLKNNYGLFTLGDQLYTDHSKFIFPTQPLQGLSYTNVFNRWDVFFYLGRNNFGSWAHELEREARSAEPFTYGRVKYLLNNRSSIALNYSNYASSVQYKTAFKRVELLLEGGSDRDSNTAKEASVLYKNGTDFTGKITYRDIEDSFLMPVGLLNYKAYKGWKYNFRYSPLYYLDLNGKGEVYKQSSTIDNYCNNIQLFLKTEKYHKNLPNFVIDISNNGSKEGTTYEHRDQQYIYKLTKKISIFNAFVKMFPSQYEDLITTASSYKKDGIGYGARLPLWNLGFFQFELSQIKYDMSATDYTEDRSNYFLKVNPVSIIPNLLEFDGYYQFLGKKNRNTNEVFYDHFYKLQLAYHLNPDGTINFSHYRKIIDEPAAYENSRVFAETRIEYSQNFNFQFNLIRGKSRITGIVYMDADYNGVYDKNEKGVEGIRIKLSDGRVSTTNRNGIYKFNDVKPGQYVLSIDGADNTLMNTDEYPKVVKFEASDRSILNFGVIQTNMIFGYVYSDANDNGKKDEKEDGIKNARIIIDDAIVKTDARGYYQFFVDDMAKKRVLQIDFSSLPLTHKLRGDRKVELVGSGKVNFIVVPVNKKAYEDDYVELTSIKKLSNGKLQITGKLVKPALSLFINDQKVDITGDIFLATVSNTGKKLKVKVYTRDKIPVVKHIDF